MKVNTFMIIKHVHLTMCPVPPASQRQQQSAPCREPSRPAPYSLPSGPADLESISRSVGHLMSAHSAGYSRDDVRDMPPGEDTPGVSEGASVSGWGVLMALWSLQEPVIVHSFAL